VTIRVALSGFHKLNRLVLRAISEGDFTDLFEVAAILSPGDPQTLAQLIKLDSEGGRPLDGVESSETALVVQNQSIEVIGQEKSTKLPWSDLDVNLVVETAGGQKSEGSKRHLNAGAKKIVVSGGSDEAGTTIIAGVNDQAYDPDQDHVVSAGSSWLNATGPLLRSLDERFTIQRSTISVLSALTESDPLANGIASDGQLRRGVLGGYMADPEPKAQELEQLFPKLAGYIAVNGKKAPVQTAALAILTADLGMQVTSDDLHQALVEASTSEELAGIVGTGAGPLSLYSVRDDPRSAIIDLSSIQLLGEQQVYVVAWYDQEWALACRVAELIALICEAGIPGTA
jgi:glyceraldehyde 3-phosphate dehydrogenase